MTKRTHPVVPVQAALDLDTRLSVSAAPTAPLSTTLTPDAIQTEARRWLGTPFRHQGRSAEGLDCVGLLIMIARAFELPHGNVTGYTRRAKGMGFLEHFHAHLTEIAPATIAPGDVLVFVEALYPCHTGILSERQTVPHLIHAHGLRGRVIEEPYLGEWPGKLRFAFRFPGLVSHPGPLHTIPENT